MNKFDTTLRNCPTPPTLWVRGETAVYGKGDHAVLNSNHRVFQTEQWWDQRSKLG